MAHAAIPTHVYRSPVVPDWEIETRLRPYQQVLFWSAAVSTEFMARCPRHEQFKYECVGALICLTGLSSSLAMHIAASFAIPDSGLLPVIVAVLWGSFIFTLDRFIVGSMSSQHMPTVQLLGQLCIRLAIASLVALTISRPVEIRMFETEIRRYLAREADSQAQPLRAQFDKDLDNRTAGIKARYAGRAESLETQIDGLTRDVSSLEAAIQNAKSDAYRFEKLAQEEQSGAGGSGRSGEGRLYTGYAAAEKRFSELARIKEDELREKKEERDALESSLSTLKDRVAFEIGSEEQKNDARLADELTQRKINQQGFIDMHRGLNHLVNTDPDIGLVVLVVTLLFLLIEVSPVIVKAISPRGVYEIWIDNLTKSSEDYIQTDIASQMVARSEAWKKFYGAISKGLAERIDGWVDHWLSAAGTPGRGSQDGAASGGDVDGLQQEGSSTSRVVSQSAEQHVSSTFEIRAPPVVQRRWWKKLGVSVVARTPLVTIVLAVVAPPMLWGGGFEQSVAAGSLLVGLYSSKVLLIKGAT